MAKPTCLLAFIRVPEVVTYSQVAGLCHAQVLHDSGPPASEVFSNSFFRFSRGKAPLQNTARFVLTSLGQEGVLFHRFTLLGAPYQNGTLQTPLATPSGFLALSIALVCTCTVPPLLQKTLLAGPYYPPEHSLTLLNAQAFCIFCWPHHLLVLSPVLTS